MDSVKLDGKSTIKILDSTYVSQTSHNAILKKESEMYKDMTMTTFNKEVSCMRKEAWSRVALYIAKAAHTFVEGGKKTIVIPYFFK
jgi:aspartate/glutamate racemase